MFYFVCFFNFYTTWSVSSIKGFIIYTKRNKKMVPKNHYFFPNFLKLTFFALGPRSTFMILYELF